MFYVYVIVSLKNKRNYIGYTNDLRRRMSQHNDPDFRGHYTSGGQPWILVYYEAFLNREDAYTREQALKNYGNVFGLLKKRILRSLEGAG
jgi:putative endonuclease